MRIVCHFKTSTQSYYYRTNDFAHMCPFIILCVTWKQTFTLIFGVSASQPDPFLHLYFLGCVEAKSEVLDLFTFGLKNGYLSPLFFETCFLVVMGKSKRGNKFKRGEKKKRNRENNRMKQSSEADVWHLAIVEWTLSTLNSVFVLHWKIINL